MVIRSIKPTRLDSNPESYSPFLHTPYFLASLTPHLSAFLVPCLPRFFHPSSVPHQGNLCGLNSNEFSNHKSIFIYYKDCVMNKMNENFLKLLEARRNGKERRTLRVLIKCEHINLFTVLPSLLSLLEK